MFQEKAHQTAEHKEKEKTLTNKHETTLNFECPTGISHLQLGQPSYSLGDRHSPSHHQHYLLGGHGLLRRYWFWKTWTKSLKGGCSSHILSEVISILDCVGEKGELRVLSTTLDRWALGITGNGNDGLLWYWDSHLVFTSLAFLHLCWRYGQPSVVSMLLTLDILQHLCGVHHAAFCCTDSRRLISLMLFGCQIELAYSRTGVTTALYLYLPFTKEEPIFRVLPRT